MPSTLAKRNAILSFLLGAVSVAPGCGERLALRVELQTPVSPDPFADVAVVRVSADLDRGVQRLGEVRWDQGPVVLPQISNPAVQRIVVEGLDETGRVISSGATGPLDLLTAPPSGPLTIDFTRIGVLSSWPESVVPRQDGRSVDLGDGRWMVVGGLGDDGCAREDTQVYGPERRSGRPGPMLPGGRGGAFSPLSLGNGEVLVVGGNRYEGCATPIGSAPWRLNADGRAFPGDPLDWPDGAAVAVLRPDLVLAAGGRGPVTAQTDVFGLDPQSFRNEVVGSLSVPRAAGTLVALDRQRALVLGGQARTSTSSALRDAAVFEPSRGATLDERIDLGAPLVDGTAVRTAAGSIILVSPDLAGGRTDIKAIVVKRERSLPLGDVTPVTVAAGTTAGPLLALGDGSLLELATDRLEWIQLLPRQARSIPVEQGPLTGGRLADGTVLLFDAEGRRFTFNPGPAAVLGWRGPAGALVAVEGPSIGLGVVPLRPARWRLTREGLEAEQSASDVELGEWAVAVDRTWADFDLTVDLEGSPGSRALVLWGATDDQFTYLSLGATAEIGRLGARPPTCDVRPGPANDIAWTNQVRVRREGRRVTVQWSPGGRLVCTFSGETGWLGLGVANGTMTFRRVRVGLP